MSESIVFRSPKNPYSHLTAKERKYPSFPVKFLVSMNYIQGVVLDFGCGLGADLPFLHKNGFDAVGYDPFYAPEVPKVKFDTILCNYVLNVLLPEEQVHVLMAVSELLKPAGKAYFVVRRDIRRSGYRLHTKLGVQVYQCNVILPYKTIFRNDHCEIYEYQHINQIRKTEHNSCPYCAPDKDTELVTESATVFAILNQHPITQGHTLVIPKQHIANYFDLSVRVKTACWLVVDRARMILSHRFKPDGFNMEINVGNVAGQTVPHAHIHLIPCYKSDDENPTYEVRNINS